MGNLASLKPNHANLRKHYRSVASLLLIGTFLTACSYSSLPPDRPVQQNLEIPVAAAVASAHPLATQAGIDILANGGNAFDAAVTVSAMLAVVEPYSSGIGGGGFWLLHRARDQKQIMIDGRERAPLAATETLYQNAQGEVIPKLSVDGALAAAIPGQPAALVHIAKQYGNLPLPRSLAPAIRSARDGFAVDKKYQRLAKFRQKLLASLPESAALFLDQGEVPEVGRIIVQNDLANTLQALAEQGHSGFYQGEVAKSMVAAVREAGGIWTLGDLSEYQIIERQPLRFSYGDKTIVSAPPPSSGGVALATILNILSGFDLAGKSKAQRIHLIVEAMRRAYRDRAEYLGDPDFVDVPIALLSDPAYAAGLRAGVKLDSATASASLPGKVAQDSGNDTTHFSILDQEGNRVSATLSINYPFGSGFVARGTGVLLNDEMDDFSAKPGVPNVYGLVGAKANAIAPGKRPLSSMTPTFVESPDGIAILGTPGGSRIITMVLLAILQAEQSNNPQQWVDLPRFHHQFLPDHIQYESGAFSEQTIDQLQSFGHQLKERSNYGNMHAIYWDLKTNQVDAASDTRGLGLAIP